MKLPAIKTLEKATSEIHRLEESSKKNMCHIANILVEVQNRKLYQEEGFKTVAEYATVKLGYQKSTTYKLIAVSERFLQGNDKSVFVETTGTDFSISQLAELIPLTDDCIRKNLDKDEINISMSSKKLRDFVKSVKVKVIKERNEPWIAEKHQSEEPNDELPFKEDDKSSLVDETKEEDGYITDKTAREEYEEAEEAAEEEESEELEEKQEDTKLLKDRIIKVKSIIREFEKGLTKKNEIPVGDVFAFLQVIENGLNGFL